VSEQELLGIVGAAAEDEVIEAEERELIESIISFGDTVAREIMVPRPDMVTVDADASVTAALDRAIAQGYSRLPVAGETSDDIVGVAHAKDLIRAEREGRGDDPVVQWARPANFIPETKPVAHLMREMQAGKYHLAVLVDEYGGTAGLVTLEDCIEELVGDIVDEHDVEDREVERLDGGDLLVDGGMAVDDLNDMLSIDLPAQDWDTIGGFLLGTLGHVPVEGEVVDHDGYRFTARRVEGRRVSLVHVGRIDSVDGHDGHDG
jgi:CBS domain containing-hemolysin-like protein